MTHTGLALATEDLTKHYGATIGCEKICLRVPRGHIFGFLGPNGAGKSTFIKMMVGLHAPTSGKAELLGRPLGDLGARARIGFLPENFRYQEWLTGTELLAFHGRLVGMDPGVVPARARSVLADVGLATAADAKIKTYSKGMQQRFGIACALLAEPELLFLDEPTSALDPGGRADVRSLLLEVRERGTTVFLNSHLLAEVEQVCDEVAVIDHGRLVSQGSLSELLTGPVEAEVDLAEPLGRVRDPVLDAGGTLLASEPLRIVVGMPDEDLVPVLVERLVLAGARIREVRRKRRTLESLFLEVTGDGSDG